MSGGGVRAGKCGGVWGSVGKCGEVMKTCTKCKKLLNNVQFQNSSTTKDRKSNHCKDCLLQYRRKKNTLINQIYGHQREKSKRRNHKLPDYTLEELKLWLKLTNFDNLYTEWVNSNFNKDLVPSLDRLNDYKPYTLGNIHVTTWKDNNIKGYKDRKNGVNNKLSKAVKQLTQNGEVLNTFPSLSEASRKTNTSISNISRACNNGGTSCGFRWEFN